MKREVKTLLNKIIFSVAFILLFFIILYLLNRLIPPFLYAGAIAYVFYPLVEKLSKKINRVLATWIVFLIVILLFFALIFLFVPLFTEQVIKVSQELPRIWESINVQSGKLADWLQSHSPELLSSIQNYQTKLAESLKPATRIVSFLATQLYLLIRRIIDFIIFLFFLFYLLKDFGRIKEWIKEIIPCKYREEGVRLLQEIDRILYGFIFGQLLVALILGIMYTIGLTIIGIPYALLIGITAGILDIIPYVGTAVGFILAAVVAFFYYSSFKMVLLVLLVFATIRAIEGYFVSPKLIGEKVGLHPIFVVFAIILGGKFFGLFGMLVFVPIFAIGKVLIIDIVNYYKDSSLFKADETSTES